MKQKTEKKDYYKHPEYGRVYGENLTTPIGRLCWTWLDKPQPLKDGQKGSPRYGVTLLLDKAAPETTTFLDTVKGMTDGMLEVYNKGNKVKLSELTAVQDGDEMDAETKEKYPFYAGMFLLSARNTELPQIKNAKTEVISGSDVKGGMHGRLVLTPHIGSTGVSYKLHLVQIAKDDGTRFGAVGTRDYGSMIDAIDSEEEVPESNKAAENKDSDLDSAINAL